MPEGFREGRITMPLDHGYTVTTRPGVREMVRMEEMSRTDPITPSDASHVSHPDAYFDIADCSFDF